jgi:retron-type reverse transcriptase
MGHGLRWVVDVDISKYFDSIDHGHLRGFLDQRVKVRIPMMPPCYSEIMPPCIPG